MKNLYSQDGVDVGNETDFSAYCGAICKNSYENSPFVYVVDRSRGHFRKLRTFKFRRDLLPEDFELGGGADGNGTKPIFSDKGSMHAQAGRDLLAMLTTDITREGGLPFLLYNVLEVPKVDVPGSETNITFKNMMLGLSGAAKEQNIILFKGETAQMGLCVGSDDPLSPTRFLWAGAALGIYHPELNILGHKLRAGQHIVALREKTLRCNGISSARKGFEMRFGIKYWENSEAQEYLKQAAAPSTLYDHFLNRANGWYESIDGTKRIPVELIVHVTGGAIREKLFLDCLLPFGLSAELPELWGPPEIMQLCAKWRGMPDRECYETWCCGQGILAVLDEVNVEPFVELATKHGVEAKVAGHIVKSKKDSKPYVSLTSGFTGEIIRYEA